MLAVHGCLRPHRDDDDGGGGDDKDVNDVTGHDKLMFLSDLGASHQLTPTCDT